jgi:dynein light chain Tctex-type 1
MDDLDVDDVNQIVREILEKVLGQEKSFERNKLSEWTDSIVYQCIDEMAKLKKPFKYIVKCFINQRDGAGLYSHSSCFFNDETDLVTNVHWANNLMQSNIFIYAMALN